MLRIAVRRVKLKSNKMLVWQVSCPGRKPIVFDKWREAVRFADRAVREPELVDTIWERIDAV